jgi:hypothetical protein
MNYKSYQTKIVDQYGVILVGYPGDKGIINPGELDAIMLKELLHRLNDGRCYWAKLNALPLSPPTTPSSVSTGERETSPHTSGRTSMTPPRHSDSELSVVYAATWNPPQAVDDFVDDVDQFVNFWERMMHSGLPQAHSLSWHPETPILQSPVDRQAVNQAPFDNSFPVPYPVTVPDVASTDLHASPTYLGNSIGNVPCVVGSWSDTIFTHDFTSNDPSAFGKG